MHNDGQSGVGPNTVCQVGITHPNEQAVSLTSQTNISMYNVKWKTKVECRFTGSHGDIKSQNDQQGPGAPSPLAPKEPPPHIHYKQRRELMGVQDP